MPRFAGGRGAGTDANVFIELHGDKAFMGKTTLDTNANSKCFVRLRPPGSSRASRVPDALVGGAQEIIAAQRH